MTDAPIISYPFQAGRVLTRVLEAGTDGPVLLLVHGAGSRADRFRAVMPQLAAAGYHVFAVDNPGHGFAAKTIGYPYGTPAFAQFLADFVRDRGLTDVTPVGTSLGGHVVATMVARKLIPVRRVILNAAVGLVPRTAQIARDTATALRITPEGVRAKLEFVVHDQALVTDAWAREEYLINTSPGAREALATIDQYVADHLNDDLVGEAFAAQHKPTLLIWGAEDCWVPPSVGEAVHRLLPDAPLCLIEGAGHAPFLEKPQAFADLTLDFLAKTEGGAS
ncbi:MAG: alpha/beta fold hydrolase [Actinobacteria bacterium]|nr:alpha/beta fold hydrolase [Actinomycetota bacterium]